MTELSPQELVLYRQCLNEVLRGYHAPEMEKLAGVSYAVLMKEDAAFYALGKLPRTGVEEGAAIPIRSQVVAEALRLLGTEEFPARTGLSLDEGYRFLEKVKKLS